MNRPASAMESSSVGGSTLRLWRARINPARLAAQRPRDHHLLHLVGALADREDLGVAVEAADGVLLDVAVAAVDLDGLLGRAHGQPPGLQLRLRRDERERLAAVLEQRRPVGE